MTLIRLTANDQQLAVVSQPILASGDKNSVEIQVALSSHWNGYSLSAVFFTDVNKAIYEVMLTNGRCTVPHEVLTKPTNLYIGIRGLKQDVVAVKTSGLAKCKITKGAPMGDSTSVEPTPDVYHQIIHMLSANSAKVEPTGDGAVITITDQNGTTTASVKNGVGITSISIEEVS